jgi:hypothetical protein
MFPHAIIDPLTVMVVLFDAEPACGAMLLPRLHYLHTGHTYPVHPFILGQIRILRMVYLLLGR